jgi:phosphoserine phosphatase
MAVLAVIFDFDDTLLPDSTSALLKAHGLDANEFWTVRAKELVGRGYDPPLAYLNLLLKEVGPDRPLGRLTNERLREFGRSLDPTWFNGLPDMFEDIYVQQRDYRDVSIEFYIVSGGLQPIIEGSEIVKKYFRGVYGCQFGEDPDTGLVSEIKRCVTFTEKTRFLFEINKGIAPEEAATQPHLVNQLVPEENRPVPFRNMIYVGDGMTDIPCFSLVERLGGTTFGVFQPGRESAKQAFQSFLQTKRVRTLHHPDYTEDAELGSLLRGAIAGTALNIMARNARPI